MISDLFVQWREAIVNRLARLRVTMHAGAHPRPVTEGIPFLGFVVFTDHRRLKRRKGIHSARRLRGLVTEYHAGRCGMDDVGASVRGWVSHVRYANSVGLRKAVLRRITLRPSERAAGLKESR